MKKVTLLGDSIRQIGYGKSVEEALKKEGIEVFQPEENCRFARYTFRMLFDYKDQIAGSDVIHWNNGLWDVESNFCHHNARKRRVSLPEQRGHRETECCGGTETACERDCYQRFICNGVSDQRTNFTRGRYDSSERRRNKNLLRTGA